MRFLSASDPFEHSAQGDLSLLDIRENLHSNAATVASLGWGTLTIGSTLTAQSSQKDTQ